MLPAAKESMALRKSSLRLATLAVVLAVALSGCAGMQFGSGDMSAEKIGEQVEQKYENVGTYTGTVTTKTVSGNETRTTTANVWMNQSGDEMRYEYVSPEQMAGTVLVSNGSTMWMYNETTDTARKTDTGGLGSQVAAPNYSQVVRNLLENYNVSYRGTETVGDRSAYVLSLTPKAGSAMAEYTDNYTLWIGEDSWYPVKRHTVMSLDGETIETTMTYTNLTFDANVSAETFEFDPPEDAEVTTLETPDRQQYESVEAADAEVSFDVAAPRHVPDGYEQGNVTVTSGSNYTSVSMSYENGTDHLSVSQSSVTAGTNATSGDDETVTVDGRTGTYSEFGSTAILRWTCGGESYTVSGPLSKSELLAVGESIDCG